MLKHKAIGKKRNFGNLHNFISNQIAVIIICYTKIFLGIQGFKKIAAQGLTLVF